MTLRRARFLLPTTTDDADEVASLPPSDAGDVGDPRGKKAEYWDGYRAAMATKAPPFTGSIASFDSDDPDEISLDGRVAELPRSPSVSDEDEPLQELETEQRLAGALAAGATVGLPGAGALAAAPSEQELAEEAAEAEAEAAAARAELAPGAAAWVDRLGKWEAVLAKAPATYISLHACICTKEQAISLALLRLRAIATYPESMRAVKALHADITHVCRACSPHRWFGTEGARGRGCQVRAGRDVETQDDSDARQAWQRRACGSGTARCACCGASATLARAAGAHRQGDRAGARERRRPDAQ